MRISQHYYSVMYKYYMWNHGLMEVPHEKQMQKHKDEFQPPLIHHKLSYLASSAIRQTCPALAIHGIMGLWNTILLYVYYFYAGILYITPNEQHFMNETKRKYIPIQQRWNKTKWLKNKVNNLFTKLCNKSQQWTCNASGHSRQQKAKYKRRLEAANRHGEALQLRPKRSKHMLAMAALLAMSVKDAQAYQMKAYFDTDYKPIGIDNRCTACISHDIKDFVGKLHDSDRTIRGF